MVPSVSFLAVSQGHFYPILFPAAAKARREALKTAHTSVDTITYTWLVMAIPHCSILNFATKGLKNMPGKLQNSSE